jgi:GNAT superfamily N-acetyltransferase
MLGVPAESEIRQVVSTILCDTFSWFNKDDPLVVEQQVRQVRVFYACFRDSRGFPNGTILECRIDLDAGNMWIGNLQVSAAHRLQGLGRELARVAERLAVALEMREINIFPLLGSVDFWRKMGYTKKPRTTRVLCKNVVVKRELAT